MPGRRSNSTDSHPSSRPAKRRKLSNVTSAASPTPSTVVPDSEPMRTVLDDTPTPSPDSHAMDVDNVVKDKTESVLNRVRPMAPLPDGLLLLMVPQLVLEPPSSPNYIRSLYISWLAMRKCTRLDLTADLEVRARTGMAEVGMLVLGAELDDEWVKGVDVEVENAISKGLELAQKHPTLSPYLTPLRHLQIQLAKLQQRTKYALSLSRQALATTIPASPLATQWLHYLQLTHCLSTPEAQLAHISNPPQPTSKSDAAFHNVASLLRLSLLFTHDPLSFRAAFDNLLPSISAIASSNSASTPLLIMAHLLSMAHIVSTEPPSTQLQLPRTASLKLLPLFLDSPPPPCTALLPDPGSAMPLIPPLMPRKLLVALSCLVGSIASYDASARQSRRGLWASRGLKILDDNNMAELPRWLTLREKRAYERQLAEVRADLLCELASVAIMRSEFADANAHLSSLWAHTQSTSLFPSFAPLVTLLHARLAHALLLPSRAKECYAASAYLAQQRKDEALRVVAQVGHVALKFGLGEATRAEVREVLDEVKASTAVGMGLGGVVGVLEALLAEEITKSKQCLKTTLDLATAQTDKHLNLLILCLIAARYHLTEPDHALTTFTTARQLALSHGAPASSADPPTVGNAAILLWIGERSVEIYKRQGKEKAAEKQEEENNMVRTTWAETTRRWGRTLTAESGADRDAGDGDIEMS